MKQHHGAKLFIIKNIPATPDEVKSMQLTPDCEQLVTIGLDLLDCSLSPAEDHLVDIVVVKASASRVEDPGFSSRLCHEDFSRSSHSSD